MAAARMGAEALRATVMVGAASCQILSLGVEAPARAAAALPTSYSWPFEDTAAAAPPLYIEALKPSTGAAQ